MNNNFVPQANSIVTVRWNVKPVDATPEQETTLKESVAAKFGIPVSNVKVERQYIKPANDSESESLTYETVHNIQDPKFQQALFFDYLKDNEITDYDEELLLSIDSQINAQIDYDAYDKCKRYDIKYIKWDNFLSYGPGNYFDFTKLKGLVLLNGAPANQSGKSTFSYDLIHFALHGKTSSGKIDVLNDYFNKYTPEATEVFVEICLTIDGYDYIIRRKLTRPELGKKNRKVTQNVEYFRLEDGVEVALEDCGENLKNGTTQQTNKVIKEAIGNEKDFDLVICANSSNLTSLISLKDTERGRLLSRWIGLLPLEKKDEIARDMWNHRINVGLQSSIYNRETLKQEIEALTIENTENDKQITNLQEKINEAIAELEKLDKDKENLLLSMKKIDANLPDIDIATLDNTLEAIKNKGLAKKAQIDAQTNRLNEIGEVSYDDNVYRELCNLETSLSVAIANLKNEINNLKTLNKTLAEGEFCPTCGARLAGVDNSHQIIENNAIIQDKINEGVATKAKIDEITKQRSDMETSRTLKFEKDKLELGLVALNSEKELLGAQWKENKKLRDDIERNLSAIEFNNQVTTQINLLKENVKVWETIRFNSNTELNSYAQSINANNLLIRQKEAIIATILEEEKLIKNWKIYLQMVGKNGISKMVLRKALPIINQEMDRLLDGVCDFKVEISIDDSNDVAFTLIRNNVRSSLTSGSGFEQTVTALALRVVLGNMSTLSKPPFILLDEVLGGVASENYDNVKKLYDRITSMYRFVFQITHLGEPITGWHDMVVTVKKDERGISSITQE